MSKESRSKVSSQTESKVSRQTESVKKYDSQRYAAQPRRPLTDKENTKPSILKKEASFTEIQDGGSAQDDKNAASLRRSNRSAAKLANESMILQNITQKSSKRRSKETVEAKSTTKHTSVTDSNDQENCFISG